MKAGELFKAGKLTEAIEAQIAEVKSHPTDHARRLFLFELLAFNGEFERARKQIDLIDYKEPELQTAVMEYKRCLEAELARKKLFTEGLQPKFLDGLPIPEHIAYRLDAVKAFREGKPVEAGELLAQAATKTTTFQGKLNDKPFTTLRDADDLFSSVLEVFAKGVYFWVPLELVALVTMSPPKTPRDLLWFPARLETQDGSSGEVFLPAIYPKSSEHADPQIRLGRANDWIEHDGGAVLGVGLRDFIVDEDAVGLLDWREFVNETLYPLPEPKAEDAADAADDEATPAD